MTGHNVDKCYKKHGYPPGWVPGYQNKTKQQGAAPMMNNLTDFEVTNDQFQKLMLAVQSQMGQTSQTQSRQLPNSAAAISLIPKFGEDHSEGKFSAPHVNFISLCNSTWILDSGATDHIACSIESFVDYHTVEGDEVSLPTGERVAVKHKGNIRLGNNLWLKDVMHIPSFHFNIVLVSRLLCDNAYDLIFSSKQCMIREPHGMTVGLAKQEKGLYLMVKPFMELNNNHNKLAMQFFYEQQFPFQEENTLLPQEFNPPLPNIPLSTHLQYEAQPGDKGVQILDIEQAQFEPTSPGSHDLPQNSHTPLVNETETEGSITDQSSHQETMVDTDENNNAENRGRDNSVPRRSNRERRMPRKLHDYFCDSVVQHRSPHLLSKVISYDHIFHHRIKLSPWQSPLS
ncbi:uncharacterized protein LOC116005799 [Ipomoea triloba]|uniref:uncharacterized protein LOC116005799 n=1 Tax=Ipomoea triloba TaxID=35885 RepID=UPI00125D46E2|nr:uncharacterized protein LOC116005799 [Ipomoea triloba]